MKMLIFTFVLTLFCVSAHAQTVSMDSTFSEDGILVSNLSGYHPTANRRTIAAKPNGSIIATGGPLSTQSGPLSIVQYSSDGSVDPNFLFNGHINFNGTSPAVGLQADGKILCGFSKGVIRLQSNGLPDGTFGQNGFVPHISYDISEIGVFPDGRFAVAGNKNSDPVEGHVVRVYHPNGKLDSIFSQDGIFRYNLPGFEFTNTAKALPDGKILLAGSIELSLGRQLRFFRLTAGGEFDPSFGTNGFVNEPETEVLEVFGMTIQPDGKIVLTGYTQTPTTQAVVLRYLPDGTRDVSFGNNGLRFIPEMIHGKAVVIRPTGEILILGMLENNSNYNAALGQLLSDGTVDTTFGNNGLFFSSIALLYRGTMSMFLSENNKVIVSTMGDNTDTTLLILQKFALDLKVGALQPIPDFQENTLIYPNPISNNFTLNFSLTAPENVSIDLFDLNGKLVKRLAQERFFDTGEHNEAFYFGQEMPSGSYVLAISIKGKTVSRVQIMKK